MNELVSVIVPVYKVEAYLDRCVESIINQTYLDLEIILVDDGSPDRCPKMCETWAQRDKRIKVIHKENGGLSDARNAGMKAISGAYVCFVDSDDWVHIRFIESLWQAIHSTGADLAACEVCFIPDGVNVLENQKLDVRVEVNTPEEALGSLIRGEKYRAVVWNKLYRKNIIIGEEFEKGKLHEDEFFTYRIIDKCRKLSFVHESLYYYRQREGSIMSTFSLEHMDALEAGLRRLNMLKEKYPSLYERDKITFCIACRNFYCDVYRGEYPDRKKALEIIREYRKNVHFSFFDWIKLSSKNKIRMIISSPRFIGLDAFLQSRRNKSV